MMEALFGSTHYLDRLPAQAMGWYVGNIALRDHPLWCCVMQDDRQMERVRAQLHWFAPEVEVLVFPAWDCQPYDRVSPHRQIISERAEVLARLADRQKGKAPLVLLTTANAMLQRVPPSEFFAGRSTVFRKGERLDRERLLQQLVESGYRRVSKVMEPGEFATRGSIIDVFPSHAGTDDHALRVDCFDDEIESICSVDPLTQASGEPLESFVLHPASEVCLTEAAIAHFRQQFRVRFGEALNHPLYRAISEAIPLAGYEHWLPLFYERMGHILDYLPGDCHILLDGMVEQAWQERLSAIDDHYQMRLRFDGDAALRGDAPPYHPLPPSALYLEARELERALAERSTSTSQAGHRGHGESTDIGATPIAAELAGLRAQAKLQDGQQQDPMHWFSLTLEHFRAQKKRVVLAAYSPGSLDRLRQMVEKLEAHSVLLADGAALEQLKGKTVGLAILPLDQGFATEKLVFLSEEDVLGERVVRLSKKRKASAAFMQEAANLEEGELVVHKEHGIGRFAGLETVTVGQAPHDCLKIIYQNNDRLFVPVEHSDAISRYGQNDEGVELDKLGSAAWQSRKAKLRQRMKVAAEALLKTAAERALAKAPVMVADSGGYDEFCTRFPYVETDDQLQSIVDVLEDMAGEKPMDRLVCGDVGFGKTEVALRAAFVAAQPQPDGNRKQVALICPTTLLCRQHFHNFSKRFEGFGYKIRQLSRLVTGKEANQTKEMIAAGEVDIVIGTHALLAESIRFKNLGLLIVDEEQNFGVAQKEKLKALRHNIHVLTLTATPIPRTLQLSLAGIKELSLITTPPVDRLAVRTFVSPYDPMMLREAIMREKLRGGKIFYVCPKIRDLDDVAARLKLLVPEVHMATAHGQMPAARLDEIMNQFYDGAFDLLLSTNIVESGLDIPTANTLIVHKAHLFGLAQLYQLRGRVGRGKQRAYAYFTLPHGIKLTRYATRRLEVMQTLDTLGAGFTIASHDMDIRGFGNILGDEQTGHIREVGVELYQTMLEEAVAQVKRESRELGTSMDDAGDEWSPQINLGTAVMIPESYIPDLGLRLGLYKRIASLADEEMLQDFRTEMLDRFGPIPSEMANLLDIVRAKQLCRMAGISKVDVGPKGVVFAFYRDQFSNPAALVDFIARRSTKVKLRADHRLVYMKEWPNEATRVEGVLEILREIADMAAPENKQAA